jgi:hypothetical protein
MKKALKNAHRERVEQTAKSREALWRLIRWGKTRGNPALVVTSAIGHQETQQEITDPAKKADVFQETFFLIPPEADLESIRCRMSEDRADMEERKKVDCSMECTGKYSAQVSGR